MNAERRQLRERCRFRPGRNESTSEYGRTYTTYRAVTEVNHEDASNALAKHLRGFWGDCSPATFANGDFAAAGGVLRLTVHYDRDNVKFGIITRAPMLDTTIFMPEESWHTDSGISKYLPSVSNL